MHVIKDYYLIESSKYAIDHLDFFIMELQTFHEAISKQLDLYSSTDEPSIENEIALKSSLSLYQKNIEELPRFFRTDKEKLEILNKTLENQRLFFNIKGEWTSHEFGLLLHAVNKNHNFFSVSSKLKQQSIDFKILYTSGREDVYREAKLFFFLTHDEELYVNKIRYESPGYVELISIMPETIRNIIFVLIVIESANLVIRSILSTWTRKNKMSHQKKMDYYKEDRERLINDMLKIMESQFNSISDEQIRQYSNIVFSNFRDTINALKERKLADPIKTMDDLFNSWSTLDRILHSGRAFFDKVKSLVEDKKEEKM